MGHSLLVDFIPRISIKITKIITDVTRVASCVINHKTKGKNGTVTERLTTCEWVIISIIDHGIATRMRRSTLLACTTRGRIKRKTPSVVAAPFPPLNCKNGESTWPNTAMRPKYVSSIGEKWYNL